jgi:Kef-type K+ transport system membrane component KefB
MTVPGFNALLLAAAEGGGAHGDIPALLGTLVAIIVGTKVLGDLAQRIGQPTVLGELVAGVLLGASVLGVLDPTDPVIASLAEIGVLVLLFEIGLHTDIKALRAVGSTALTVALAGVVLPFAFGYFAARWLGVGVLPSIVCGAALTATSIGISARVLSDLRRLETPDGQVVLGAAVLDDVVGLVILAVVAGMAGGESVGVGRVAVIAGSAIGFVVLAIAVPPLFRFIEHLKVSGGMGILALAFAFATAWLANAAGSALIIGAFAAGLVLHPTPQRREIELSTTKLGYFFVPIFFASVGASVELSALADPRPLLIGGVLIVVAIIGKVAAGYAPTWYKGDKLLIGLAMVPRGEVGLIFAQMGLATGAISPALFGALMLMVLATTFITPPALTALVKRREVQIGRSVRQAQLEQLEGLRGDGGIDDLVAGIRPRDEN